MGLPSLRTAMQLPLRVLSPLVALFAAACSGREPMVWPTFTVHRAQQAPRLVNPVSLENERAGTLDWIITAGASDHEVEGYASVTSAAPGETVDLFINVPEQHTVTWHLYRIGWYGGDGGRLVAESAALPVAPQDPCPVDATTGMVECNWVRSASVRVGADWVTGQYLFKLVRDDGVASYVPLVVRERTPRAPLLYQSSVLTWQAYNLWGGTSLYKNLLGSGAPYTKSRAMRVSFDRPYEYARPLRAGQPETEVGSGELVLSELWMLRWLERKGYDMAYVTNVDVDARPELLDGRRMFLSVGHDEYWTEAERDAVSSARDGGLSLGFFSANDAYWRVRLDPSSSGAPDRVVTCYKDAKLDPMGKTPLASVRFRDTPDPQPESTLIGEDYDFWTNIDAFPMVVSDPSHWIYEGTGIEDGDTLPHLVGYEWDRARRNSSTPADLEIVATSPTMDEVGEADLSTASVYYPTPDSVVFASGTISWAWGLGKPGYADDRVARVTENVLARGGIPNRTPTEVMREPAPADAGYAGTVTVVAGSGVAGYADGPASKAQFDFPVGVARASDGTLYVTEARNHNVRRIGPDGTVSTLAGCGTGDSTYGKFKNGQGTAACFSLPSGIVVGADDNVYVSDTYNHRIRKITPDGTVTTFAGTGANGGADSKNPLKAQLGYPRGLAVGPDGALYVIAGNYTIRRVAADGVSTVAKGDRELSGVAVAPDGTVYAVCTACGGVSVVTDGALVPIVNPGYEFGDLSGPGSAAMMRPAEGIAVNGDELVVSDAGNYKVRAIARGGDHAVRTLAGDGLFGTNVGTGASARLVLPRGLALEPGGLLVVDSGNHRILRITY